MTLSQPRGRSLRLTPLVAALASAACLAMGCATFPATAGPARAEVVNCAGNLVTVDIASATVQARRALADALPQVRPQPATCLVTNPRLDGQRLEFEMPATPFDDPAAVRYRTVRLDLPTGQVSVDATLHSLADPLPLRRALDAAVATPAGQALLPFSRTEDHGGRIVLASESDRAGRYGLLRLADSPAGRTAFVVVDTSAGTVHVVAEAPLANTKQLHLSQSGRFVLVEEAAAQPGAGASSVNSAAQRSGRVVEFDIETGRIVRDQVIPMLASGSRDIRVMCFSADGAVVLASHAEGRLWLVQGENTSSLDVDNDVSSRCFFPSER